MLREFLEKSLWSIIHDPKGKSNKKRIKEGIEKLQHTDGEENEINTPEERGFRACAIEKLAITWPSFRVDSDSEDSDC